MPQGSCLGPLLFSIFANDLPYFLKQTKVVMYADDSTMFCAASTCNKLTDVLCKEFQTVSDWAEDNKLVLNITKTTCMVVGTRIRIARDSCLNLSMGGIPIEQVRKIKLLGIIIDDQLSWSDHIDSIAVKMGQGLAKTRRCSYHVTPSIRNQVVQALVLSHLGDCRGVGSSAAKNI